MQMKMIAAGIVLGACCLTMTAQPAMGTSAAKPAIGAAAEPSKALDDMLTLFEGDVMGAVKAMPAEKYNFAPSAAIFVPAQTVKFETVRTFAQQATHLAQANYYFYSAVSGLKPETDVKAIGSMTKKEDIVAALAASFVFAHKAIATITPENAFIEIKGVDGMQTRATVAAFGVAHGYDHYGQLVEYLRMNGIIPPSSAK
jgi:uncharacterized damage-inducible protein DinB